MASEITKLIVEIILGLIITAFAFVAGLAWNDAIQALITQFVGTRNALPSLLFIYARFCWNWVLINRSCPEKFFPSKRVDGRSRLSFGSSPLPNLSRNMVSLAEKPLRPFLNSRR